MTTLNQSDGVLYDRGEIYLNIDIIVFLTITGPTEYADDC